MDRYWVGAVPKVQGIEFRVQGLWGLRCLLRGKFGAQHGGGVLESMCFTYVGP